MIGCCLMLFFKGSFTKSFLSFFGFIQLELRIQPAVSFLIWGHLMCAFRVLTHTFLYSWLIKSTRLRNIAFTLFFFFQRKNCIFIMWASNVGDSQWQVLGSPGVSDVLTGSNVTWASWRGGWGQGSGCWQSSLVPSALTCLLLGSHSFPTLPEVHPHSSGSSSSTPTLSSVTQTRWCSGDGVDWVSV